MALRERFWIDNDVQGALVGRVVMYWSFSVLYFAASIACFQMWANPDLTIRDHWTVLFDQLWPCMPSMILLLPLVVVDVVRLSNRFAGPIYRVKNHLARLVADSRTYRLGFRDGDYWVYLAEPINTLQDQINGLEDEVAALKRELALRDAQDRLVASNSDILLNAETPLPTSPLAPFPIPPTPSPAPTT